MGCRASADKRGLVRVVGDGTTYSLDPRQIAPGRGAYLHPGCGARALRTRAVQRALRLTPRPSEQLAELLAALDADAAAWGSRGGPP